MPAPPKYEITGDELIAHCRSKVAKFKVPRVVRIVAELPKNAVGKIAKIELKKSLEEQNPRYSSPSAGGRLR